VVAWGLVLTVFVTGCGPGFLAPLAGMLDPEGDGTVATATQIVWEADTVTLVGDLATVLDVDVYDLGPLAPGVRLQVEVVGSDGLDPVAAVFDADENRFAFADDVDYPAGELAAVIDEVVRHESERYTLAVAGFGISPKPATAGRYEARVTRSSGQVPAPEPHTVVIRFDGGSGVFVDDEIMGRLGPWDVPPFDPETLIPSFADAYDTIRSAVAAAVRETYTGLNLTVLTSDDLAAATPAEPFSSVYLVHGFAEARELSDLGIYGVAQADYFNKQRDEAIFVFVEPLAALSPNADVFTNLVANLAAHEIGHALGLLHVNTANGLLRATLPLSACCELNPLERGPMVEFPIGFEDQMLLLTETLGPAAN